MGISNLLMGLLSACNSAESRPVTRQYFGERTLRCESLEKRRMLSGISPVAPTVVDADPISDVVVVGSPIEMQESATSNSLVDADGLGPAATTASSPNYSPVYTTINGRDFGYYVPESYDPSTPTPLLFMFHGMGGNSSEQSGGSAENGYYGWQTTAHENGFIVLFPESLGFFKTWDLGAGGSSSDLPFVDDMIDWAETNYNINSSQIFTTGHSWGAYFSYYVARYRSDDIAAFAAHSGGLGGAFFLGSTPPVPSGPSPTPALNGIVLHAVDDGIVPYSNSQSLYDDLVTNGHNVYDDGIGADGIIEVDGWGPDNHRYRLQHNQTQWDFFLEVSEDDVPLVLSVAVADTSIAEGAGAAASTFAVTRSDPRGNLTVTLTCDDTSEATIPGTVTFVDGQSTAQINIAAVDDSDVDGTQTVTLSAAAPGYTGASDSLEVTDDDVPLVLSLSFTDESFSETYGEYATLGTVTRSDPRGDLTIALESSDTSEAIVPTSITLNDGESTAYFPVTAIDDDEVDGDQTATISASADGYANTSANLAVTDDDTDVVRVIDNGDMGFTHTGFRYQNNRQVVEAYGGDNHNVRSDTGAATWRFTDLDDGEYRVSATWNHKYENRYNTFDAPLTISNGAGTELASTTLDQTIAPSGFLHDGVGWNEVGVVNVTDGVLTVTLSAGTNPNRHTVADAILIDRIGSIVPSLSLTLPTAPIGEADGSATATATVTRTDTRGDLTVFLASNDPGEATVPESVTIFDGSASASFEISAVDDNLLDGTQEATITATADSYRSADGIIGVYDDEASTVKVIDNGDMGFTHTGFRYQNNRQVVEAYGGDNHNVRSDTGAATWRFTDLDDGEYRVSATWNHKYENRYNTFDAPLTISNGAGTELESTTLDQTIAPSGFLYDGVGWNEVGVVNVTDGVLTVTLSAGTNPNRHTVADAILIDRIGDVPAAPATNAFDAEAADALFASL